MLFHTLVATCLAVLFSHFMCFSTSSTSDCNCTSAYHCHRGILHDLSNRTTWWQGSPTFWVVLITQSRRLYSTGWQTPMTQNAIALHAYSSIFYKSISISPAFIKKAQLRSTESLKSLQVVFCFQHPALSWFFAKEQPHFAQRDYVNSVSKDSIELTFLERVTFVLVTHLGYHLPTLHWT